MKQFTTLLFTFIMLFGFSGSLLGQITENFDTGLPSSYTTGDVTLNSGTWTVQDVYQESSSNSRGGTGQAARINDDTQGAHITTPSLNTVGTVEFYYRELNSGGGTFSVQKSVNGGAFLEITTQSFSGNTFTQFSYEVNDSNTDVKIRIVNDDQSGHLIIDDFSSTAYSSDSSPVKLVISEINEGNDPVVGNSFEVIVQAQDGDDVPATVLQDTSVTLSVNNGTGTVSGTLTGTILEGETDVIFSSLSYDVVESFDLIATNTGGSLTSASTSVTVLSVADQLVIVDFPSSGTEESVVSSFTVEARRSSDNSVDISYTEDITISKASGSGSLGGTATKTAVDGVATFDDLTFSEVDDYTISATDGSLTSTTSSTISITDAPKLIISEVADPGDDYNGRFVELFNAGSTSIDFSTTDYYFVRQSNGGNLSSIKLTGTLAAGETYTIANQSNFNTLYGFNSTIDFGSVTGNGDDGYWIATNNSSDATLKSSVVDIFGVVDVDGSGEDWEYEDSRAVRKNNINSANATWTSSEWIITSADVANMTPGDRYENYISGTEGWRILSSPTSDNTYDDLLGNLWTQGITTGADVTNGTPNVQTYDGSTFNGVNDLTATMSPGVGFITYVYSDDDNDGSAEGFPKRLSLSGTENTGSVSPTLTSGADAWTLVGNPFASTIDWDELTKTDLTGTVYVYDHSYGVPSGDDVEADGSAGSYRVWNGISGSLTDGLIAPFQGFWVQNSSSPSSEALTFEEADKTTGGTFYKKAEDAVVIKLRGELDHMFSESYLSFTKTGELGKDNFDGLKLSPLDFRPYVSVASVTGNTKLGINNLPLTFEEKLTIPVNIEAFTTNKKQKIWVQTGGEVTLSWPEIKNLPETWSLTLNDFQTGATVNMKLEDHYVFELETTGKAKAGPVMTVLNPQPPQPEILAKGAESPRFSVTISKNEVVTNEPNTKPTEFALEQNYPNPFNPTTSIQYSVPETGQVQLTIYNVMGQQVETLVSETKSAGNYRVSWNAANMASGIYYYRLQAGNDVITRQMTLIK